MKIGAFRQPTRRRRRASARPAAPSSSGAEGSGIASTLTLSRSMPDWLSVISEVKVIVLEVPAKATKSKLAVVQFRARGMLEPVLVAVKENSFVIPPAVTLMRFGFVGLSNPR